jgi:hypothetical protein
MTRKKYLAVFIVIGVLLALAVAFFFVAMPFRRNNTTLFATFTTVTYVSVLAAVLMIAINYKRLVAFDLKRRAEALPETFFEAFPASLERSELERRLMQRGYTLCENGLFCRTDEEDKTLYRVLLVDGSEGVDVDAYRAKLETEEKTADLLFYFSSELLGTLHDMHAYIKETLADIIQNRNRCKRFFVPCVISPDRVFFLQAQDFYGEFQQCAWEILGILQIVWAKQA